MVSPTPFKEVLVTGGAGYVGAVLVPKLLDAGYRVSVLDLYLYGDDVLADVKGHPGLEQIKGDIRDRAMLERAVDGCDAVIHLACISNDPSFELNPELGKSINYDAFFDSGRRRRRTPASSGSSTPRRRASTASRTKRTSPKSCRSSR